MDIFNDTIAAVSTPRGTGGIAVIRISGSGAFAAADKMLAPFCGKKPSEMPACKLSMCTVNGESGTVDTCMFAVFRAPHSYTGEDTVEVYCHGGALCTSMVLASAFVCGARQALAGEFTKRAFINGKLSLSAAEAVGELIHAKTKAAVTLSNSNVSGTLDREISKITDDLRGLLASVYVYIDYPDEELYDVGAAEMRERLVSAKSAVDALSATYRSGMAISAGVKTAIVGTPNTGKSTLLNLLCKKDRAIVTDIAGTTRDVVTEQIALGDVLLILSDTAGVRDTDDAVEKIGVEKSLSEIGEAELVIAVFDGSRDLSEDDERLASMLASSGKTVLAVINKSDLGTVPSERVRSLFENVVTLSARDPAAYAVMEETVGKMFISEEIDLSASPVVTTARMHASLVSASDALGRAAALLAGSDDQTLAGVLCEEALASLEQCGGRAVSEEIVSEIFSKFCVGK